MGWKSLYLSNKHHLELNIDHKRLSITKEGKVSNFRISDIDFILIDSYRFRISGRALEAISENHVPLVLTSSKDHMPCLQLINPYSGHHKMGKTISAQAQMTKKEKLTIWKEIISYKIISQGALIREEGRASKMSAQAFSVKSSSSLLGIEGSWGRYYWSRLIKNKEFCRVPKVYGISNDIMNSFLNYTYAIIRARVASAISEDGMLPLFSLFHRREYNQFALADDMIEPYRWCADKIFRDNLEVILGASELFLSPEHKKLALSVLHQKVYIPSLSRSFNLDEAIRMGMHGLRKAILTKNNKPLEDILCHAKD